MQHVRDMLAGPAWHDAVEEAATLASTAAGQEADIAARDAVKHVYILSGYAEPSRASSASKPNLTGKARGEQDPAAECEARSRHNSRATSSGAEEQPQCNRSARIPESGSSSLAS